MPFNAVLQFANASIILSCGLIVGLDIFLYLNWMVSVSLTAWVVLA
jgi:hypothetical protein